MPTADYIDTVTNEIFEKFFVSRPIPETVINENTGNEARRIYSGNIGFEFKGTGFYETDYKKKG